MGNFGIYIHWPFCLSKCPYCDFFSQISKNTSQAEIIEAYIKDLNFYHQMTKEKTVTSIFFGGGTPSLIEPQNIERLINHIKKKWHTADNVEISLEANPNTNHPNMFQDLKSAGINRLSLGIQSLREEDLKFLGRTHNAKEAFQAIDEVLNTFNNHSMDMIYALPHQQLNNWEHDLEKVTNFGFKHISLYQLTIEDGTVFAKQKMKLMDDEQAIEMYNLTTDILADNDYNRYEISNFSKPKFECRHNLLYWQGDDYVGVGKTAHGRIGLKATTHRRKIESLTTIERAEELIMMGLRLQRGINKQKFEKICGLNFDKFIATKSIPTLLQEGLIENTKESFKTTKTGFLLLNYIIENIVP
ncbi:MAG: radical SAM family heme chaperone HemW [Alphaproteobacteria bacterium]|nr:radical SAM family heme chaperone HemW [Alphaproteobacteria bacterium]